MITTNTKNIYSIIWQINTFVYNNICNLFIINIYHMKKSFLQSMKSGFTLIEMLIVIVIIGILAAVLIPRMIWSQSKARNTSRVVAVQQISNALVRYQWDNWTYPAALSELVTSKYLKSLPLDPQGGALNDFTSAIYTQLDNWAHYKICVKLETEWTNANANHDGDCSSVSYNTQEQKWTVNSTKPVYFVWE